MVGQENNKTILKISTKPYHIKIDSRKIAILTAYNPIAAYKLPGNDGDAIRALSDEESNRIFKKCPPIVYYKGRRIGSFKKAWKTALRKAGIRRRIRPYDLRHTFVTNLLERGAELKTVSEIVGHTRPDTTLRLYHQVIPGRHKEAIKLVPRLYATDEPDRSTEQAEGKEGQKKGQHKNDS
jgi:integrase